MTSGGKIDKLFYDTAYEYVALGKKKNSLKIQAAVMHLIKYGVVDIVDFKTIHKYIQSTFGSKEGEVLIY